MGTMVQVNIQEQETRYAELKQGDRKFLSTFKLRFDNQVKANIGAGVAAITEPKRALDFVCELDPKRYRSMLTKMRNSALNMEDNACPQSLSACRIASGWVNEEERGFSGAESHSAFVFELSLLLVQPPRSDSVCGRERLWICIVLHIKSTVPHLGQHTSWGEVRENDIRQ